MEMNQNQDNNEGHIEIVPGEYSPDKIAEKFDKYASAKGTHADEMLAQAIQYMMHKER